MNIGQHVSCYTTEYYSAIFYLALESGKPVECTDAAYVVIYVACV